MLQFGNRVQLFHTLTDSFKHAGKASPKDLSRQSWWMPYFLVQCLMRQVAFGTALFAACNLTAPALPPLTPRQLLFQETPTEAHSAASHFFPLQSVSTKLSQKWASNDQSCLFHSLQLVQWGIILLNCSGTTTVGKGFLKLEFHNRKSLLSLFFRLYSCNHCMLSSGDLAAFCSMGLTAGLLWEMQYSAQSSAEYSACWPKIPIF